MEFYIRFPLGLVVSVILLFAGFLYKFLTCPLRRLPGPYYTIFTNLILKWKVLSGQRSMYIHDLHCKYGPVVRISPFETSAVDAESFIKIYKSDSDFKKSNWYLDFTAVGPDNPPGLFAMAGHREHGARRRLLAQAFSNSSVLRYEQFVRDKANTAVDKIALNARESTADILKWWTFMATDVIAELSFGESFGMLEKGERNQYVQDVEATFMLSGIRVELPWLWSALSIIPMQSVKILLGAPKRIRMYGTTAIGNLINRSNHPTGYEKATPNLFSHFWSATQKNIGLTAQDITTEASNFIVAGSDTTGVSMMWLIWSLLHPSNIAVRQKLMTEIDAAPKDLSTQEILKLPYLTKCIDESLRIYAGGPTLPRVVPESGMMAGGHFLPAQTIVGSQTFTTHRDPKVFDQPDRYMPERWDQPTPEMKEMFAPFSKGSRICLGLHLARMEMTVATFIFFQKCRDIKLAPQTTDASMEFENYFVIVPKSHQCLVQF